MAVVEQSAFCLIKLIGFNEPLFDPQNMVQEVNELFVAPMAGHDWLRQF